MSSRRTWFVEPLALKLFSLVSALVLGVLIPAAYVLTRQYFNSALDLKRAETDRQTRVIAIALQHQHQLTEQRPDLLDKMIEGFSSDPRLKRLLVVDHDGRVALTNDSRFADRVFDRRSPPCQVCHARAADQRPTSAVVDLEGGTVLRSVYPMRNEPACHECHDQSQSVNGVLIADTDIADVTSRVRAQVKAMAAAMGLIAVALLTGVTLAIRFLVLRRLARIEVKTRAMSAGDFRGRVEMGGTDAVARLANEFNGMADSVTDLVSQLRRQRSQLENVMNSVDDGLLVIDRTFSVIAANTPFAQRVDSTRENILFRRCSDIWTLRCDCTGAQGGRECAAMACFTTGQLHKCFRSRYTRDGARREEEVFASPIFDPNGEVEQVVEVWRDITERRSREARMAEFQRLVSLGMLASGFSHEINTPLGTMLVHVDDIRRAAHDRAASDLDRASESLEVIRSEILRCRDLTQQFLQLSRGQSIRQELLDIGSVVRGTLPLIGHVAREKGLAIRVSESSTAPVALANGGAVQQVLLNILLNAVQASRSGGEVRLGWHTDATGGTAVTIEDDGIGMAPEVREQVFEPFFTRQPSGTGLGLFVSLNLARQWGGDIHVISAPDRGSTFEVTFPTVTPVCRSIAS